MRTLTAMILSFLLGCSGNKVVEITTPDMGPDMGVKVTPCNNPTNDRAADCCALGSTPFLGTSVMSFESMPNTCDVFGADHEGCDITFTFNSPYGGVYAYKNGQIIHLEEGTGTIAIRHGNGSVSYYSSLHTFASGFELGRYVQQGEQIGIAVTSLFVGGDAGVLVSNRFQFALRVLEEIDGEEQLVYIDPRGVLDNIDYCWNPH